MTIKPCWTLAHCRRGCGRRSSRAIRWHIQLGIGSNCNIIQNYFRNIYKSGFKAKWWNNSNWSNVRFLLPLSIQLFLIWGTSYLYLWRCLLILVNFSVPQQLQVVEEAHSMFVTGLEWLPTQSKASQMVRGYSDASVLSISCDNSLKIHHIPRPGKNNGSLE